MPTESDNETLKALVDRFTDEEKQKLEELLDILEETFASLDEAQAELEKTWDYLRKKRAAKKLAR